MLILNFNFQEFFLNIKNITRRCDVDKLAVGYSKWLPNEIELDQKFSLCKTNGHAALCGMFLFNKKQIIICINNISCLISLVLNVFHRQC